MKMKRENIIRIGTRGSLLAVKQTDLVIAALTKQYPKLQVQKVILKTKGDKLLNQPLSAFGGKGVFITEFEEALADGRIDLAIHSAKDMPMELADGLVIAGVLPRADVRDVLVTGKGSTKKAVIGTGSLRRQFQLKTLYPDMQCISIRGNVPTRLQKVREKECDGVILAAAGLERLGLLAEPDMEYHYFSEVEMVPAGGQGIIAIESRKDEEITTLVKKISDRKAKLELETERRILQLLEAGCQEAIGVISKVEKEQIAVRLIRESEGKLYCQQGNTAVEKRMELAQELVEHLM